MARGANVSMPLILLCVSCFFASPTTQSATETSNEETKPCDKELKEKFYNLFHKLINESEKLPVLPRQKGSQILSDRLKPKESSSSESSAESFERTPDDIAQQATVLLEMLDLVMQSINHTISSSSCFKHLQQPMNQAASHIAKLQEQSSFSCETSPLICFVFRLVHWIYVEPTYGLLQLLRSWINGDKIRASISALCARLPEKAVPTTTIPQHLSR